MKKSLPYIPRGSGDRIHSLLQTIEQYEILVNNLVAGIYIVQNNKIIFVNNALSKICGYSNEEIVGKMGPEHLIDPEHMPGIMDDIARRLAGRKEETTRLVTAKRKDGTKLWIEISGHPIMYYGHPSVMGTAVDVTKHKLLEIALESSKIELDMLNTRLVELNRTDGLTGLRNQKNFWDQMKIEVIAANRGGHFLALALFDIDNFKEINDKHGHACGDEVLMAFSRIMEEHTPRKNEIPSRCGGEEFGLILPFVRSREAKIITERIRKAFNETPINLCNGTTVMLSVSAGVADYIRGKKGGEDKEANDLFRRADAQLYRAKHSGKNRVCVEDDSE